MALLAVGIVSLPLYMRLFAGTVKERLRNSDGSVIAERRDYNFASATDAAQTTVQLRTGLNPFRYIVFAGSDYGADVLISWIDARTLLIRCVRCDNLQRHTMEQQWPDVSIRYDIQ
jgi:hypothetical protein